MKPDLVTFDCAQTLIDVKWNPGEFAMTCADHCGLKLDGAAHERFSGLLRDRQREYLALNLTRDSERCQGFWDDLTADWLKGEGADPDFWFRHMKAASNFLGFRRKSTIFKVYEDVVPCLKKLRSYGIPMAMVSNWDFSLHAILETMELRRYFDYTVASLEHGFEKPDPRIFAVALDAVGADPSRCFHIGDDPIDDLQGARNAGMQGILVDRKLPAPMARPYIRSLRELWGAFRWSD